MASCGGLWENVVWLVTLGSLYVFHLSSADVQPVHLHCSLTGLKESLLHGNNNVLSMTIRL